MRFSRILGSFLLILGVAGFPLVSPPVASAANYSLTVTKTSGGSVSSSPPGISCGFDCNQSYLAGTNVTLTAAANAGYKFTGWSGACTGTGGCAVTMNSAKSVTATFAAIPKYTLSVSPRPSGGSVTSTPAGINCGYTCSKTFSEGTVVTLKAAPSAGKVLTGWGGACAGTQSTCTVTMNSAKTVSATFGAPVTTTPTTTTTTTTVATTTTTAPTSTTTTTPPTTYLLGVRVSGNGAGRVVSDPQHPGIDCPGSNCSKFYAAGATVTLTATPTRESFLGWGGACQGTGTCTVTMDGARSVTAMFGTPNEATVTIIPMQTGSGTVRSTPAGIDCHACTVNFPAGTNLSLEAIPDGGSYFGYWSSTNLPCDWASSPCNFTLEPGYQYDIEAAFCSEEIGCFFG